MMLRMYPLRPRQGQDLSKEPIVTVPNQAMTLQQIIDRFIRKESLPVGQEGVYGSELGEAQAIGDLEKVGRQDFTVQDDMIRDVRSRVKDLKARQSKPVESPAPVPTPSGVVTGSTGQGQAPPA